MTATQSDAPLSQAHSLELPRITLSTDAVEGLKWLGLLLMTLDHINKYLLADSVHAMFFAGRLAMPIFAFVLAYNLARRDTLERGVYRRTMKRLAIFGGIACVPYTALGVVLGGWWPLNILATFLVAVAMMNIIERGGHYMPLQAGAVFLIGGALVEFWWPAIVLCLAAWRYFKQPSVPALLWIIASFFALWAINGNAWAFASLPILLVSSKVQHLVPRGRYTFYAFYPSHLAMLWLLTHCSVLDSTSATSPADGFQTNKEFSNANPDKTYR